MATTYKSFVGGKDVKWWDGIARTFSRLTSTGGQLTLNKVGSAVDILEVYGAGITYSDATISDAVNKIGSRAVTLLFQPGTWTITNDITIPANISIMAPQGVTISINTGKTVTVNGTIIAGSYQIFDGAGTVAGAPILCFKDPTWFSGTITDSTTPTWKTPRTSVVETDTINETTAAAGVTIDSVLLKDNGVTATSVSTDTITEKTTAAGVTIDGVKLKDSEPYCDVVNEKTTDAGVTIDGVKLKDSQPYCDVINEKTSTTGVTIDSCLVKDGSSARSHAVYDGTNIIHTKIIDIGNWNMDATASISVSIGGITQTKIRAISGVIRMDDDIILYPAARSNVGFTELDIQIDYVMSGSVYLSRRTGGIFDSVSFDATSFNRGWITITYVE